MHKTSTQVRKLVLAFSAAAAFALAGSSAHAAPLGNPSALAGAIDEVGGIETVHCRPGWRHHYPTRWRRANGCRRYYRPYGYYAPGLYAAPSFGFSYGSYPRRHFHGHRWHRGRW